MILYKMRWKLLLIFLVFILILNVGAKTISPLGSKIVTKFEDGSSSKTVDDDDEFYINVPIGVTLVNASFTIDIKDNNVDEVEIGVDGREVFDGSLSEEVVVDFIDKVDTDCNSICRWKVEIKSDDDFKIKSLFINYTYSKTPLFNKYMKDEVKWSGGSKTDVFDLDDYFYGDVEEYKYEKDDLEGVEVEIDSSDEVSFTAEAGWSGTGYITFIADDDTDTVDSNKIKLIVGSGESTSYQFSPNNSTIVLKKGGQQAFGVSGSGSFIVDWYVNEKKIINNLYTYVYSANNVGIFNVEARIGSTKKVWIISVLEPDIVEPIIPEIEEVICGDDVRDEGEDCSNCPEDVKCVGKAECVNGRCIIQKSDLGWVLWIVIFGGVIGLVVVGVILIKKNKLDFKNIFKRKKKIVKEVKKEEKDLNSLREYLLGNIEKGHKKENLVNAALKQGWSREDIDSILKEQVIPVRKGALQKELEPLKNYIKDGIRKGYKRNDLVNAAMKIGWKKEQIDEVLKEI